jgi:hypothetical protein
MTNLYVDENSPWSSLITEMLSDITEKNGEKVNVYKEADSRTAIHGNAANPDVPYAIFVEANIWKDFLGQSINPYFRHVAQEIQGVIDGQSVTRIDQTESPLTQSIYVRDFLKWNRFHQVAKNPIVLLSYMETVEKFPELNAEGFSTPRWK